MGKEISVIITGPTGMAGSGVLQACIDHPAVNRITAVSRKPFNKKNDKLTIVVLDDFLDWGKIEKALLSHDACFWCLGVSQSDVNKADYWKITYEFTMVAAKVLDKTNPGMTFCFLTGLGTKENSFFRWAKVKSKAATDLRKFNLNVFELRPGFIHPQPGVKNRYLSAKLVYPFIKNSKTMCVESYEFGKAMINVALNGSEKKILENADIRELGRKE